MSDAKDALRNEIVDAIDLNTHVQTFGGDAYVDGIGEAADDILELLEEKGLLNGL